VTDAQQQAAADQLTQSKKKQSEALQRVIFDQELAEKRAQKGIAYSAIAEEAAKKETTALAEQTENVQKNSEQVIKNAESNARLAAAQGKTNAEILTAVQLTPGLTEVLGELTDKMAQLIAVEERVKLGRVIEQTAKAAVAARIAEAHGAITYKEGQKQLNEEIGKQPAIDQERAKFAKDYDAAMKVLNETHEKHAKVSHAAALSENQLAKAVADARAALIGDDFKARDTRIDEDIKARRRALEITHKLTADAEQDLATLSGLQHEKVLNDKFLAEQSFEAKLRDMRIAGIADEEERRKAETAARIEDEANALIKQFGISKETTDKIRNYSKAAWEEFERWKVDYHRQTDEKMIRLDEQMMKQVLRETQAAVDEIEKSREDAMDKQLKDFKKMNDEFIKVSLLLANRGFTFKLPDAGEVQKVTDKLKDMHVTIEQIAETMAAAGANGAVWAIVLDHLTGKTTTFGSISRAVFTQYFKDLIRSGELFNMLGDALGNLFEGMITGTKNAKAIMYNFLAEILSGLGRMAITAGTALLFLPEWLTGVSKAQAALMIAAGVACLALAGVFRGLASNAQDAARASATAGGGAAAATPGATQNPAIPPNVIPFPTSGQGQTVNVTVQLDRSGTKDFLGGKPITEEGASGPQARLISRAARKGAA